MKMVQHLFYYKLNCKANEESQVNINLRDHRYIVISEKKYIIDILLVSGYCLMLQSPIRETVII